MIYRFITMTKTKSLIGKCIVYKVTWNGVPEIWADHIEAVCENGYYNSMHGLIKKSIVIGIYDTYEEAKLEHPEIYN